MKYVLQVRDVYLSTPDRASTDLTSSETRWIIVFLPLSVERSTFSSSSEMNKYRIIEQNGVNYVKERSETSYEQISSTFEKKHNLRQTEKSGDVYERRNTEQQ